MKIEAFKHKLSFIKNNLFNKKFRREVLAACYYDGLELDEYLILYESFRGDSVGDSPYAIFLDLLNDPMYKEYSHCWVVKEGSNLEMIRKYEGYSNVSFVVLDSDEYIRSVFSAKYIINNNLVSYYHIRREGQVYVNTWHGTPLKTLAKDITGVIQRHRIMSSQKEMFQASYLVMPNRYTTNKMLESYDVADLFSHKIAEIGYPRVDFIHNTDQEELKTELGIPQDKEIILYAPTWRGELSSIEDASQEVLKLINQLKKQLPANYVLYMKLHHFTFKYMDEELKKSAIPSNIDINQFLSITDILITDYSSVFYDFLSTQKPIIFYLYDEKQYLEKRGLYTTIDQLPGPIARTTNDLIDIIKNLPQYVEQYKEQYNKAIQKYAYMDDGKATERFKETIFQQNTHTEEIDIKNTQYPTKTHTYTLKTNNKEKTLIYMGNIENKKQLQLIKEIINKTQNDIYLIGQPRTDEAYHNLQQLKNIHILYKRGGLEFTQKEYIEYHLMKNNQKYNENIIKHLFQREYQRIFNNTIFTTVIDTTGTETYWTALLAYSPNKNKILYTQKEKQTSQQLYKHFTII